MIGKLISGWPAANMEFSSRMYTSPSFNRNSSSDIADIADRAGLENGFNDDDVFSFSGDDNQADIGDGEDDEVNTNPHTEMVNQTAEEAPDEDEHEFEFPVVCGDSNLFQISVDESVSEDQFPPRYPLFDRSLLSEGDFNLCNGVDTSKTDSKPPTVKRSSLMKLFDEDRETTSTSTSSSEAEADELDGITPGTYCVWKPKTDPDPNPDPRGKHKKSNSISIGNSSNRWKVRDLLKRSYSNDNYSTGKDSPVFLFIPPISPEKVNQIGKTAVGGRVASTKTEKKIPAYKSKIGNVRLPSYLPYREDQLYANFTGPNKNFFRY